MNEVTTDATRGLDTLAAAAREHHANAQSAFASAVEEAILCGRALIEAKEQVKHGEWLPWLKESFPASARTAQNYMRLANAPNTQALADLGVEGALKQLAAPRPEGGESPPSSENADTLSPLDRYFATHHILPDAATADAVMQTCKEMGIAAVVEEMGEDEPIPFVWFAYVPWQTDDMVGDTITYHPGWADYCIRRRGADSAAAKLGLGAD